MHTGGGKTMLVDVLNAVKDMKHIIFIVYVDERFDEKSFLTNNITFKKCKLYKRIFLIKKIQKLSVFAVNLSQLSPIQFKRKMDFVSISMGFIRMG